MEAKEALKEGRLKILGFQERLRCFRTIRVGIRVYEIREESVEIVLNKRSEEQLKVTK